MMIRKTGQWSLARVATSDLKEKILEVQNLVVKREVQRFRAAVVESFDTSGKSSGKAWEPLKPSTVRFKRVGGSKPLVGRGDLRNSIVAVSPAGRPQGWVGVKSSKTSSDGTRMVDIARVHEFGKIIVVRVTDKMRRFLMVRLGEVGGPSGGGGGLKVGSVLVIRIPRRSFLQQTFDHEYGVPSAVKQRILQDVAMVMGPGWAG